MLEGSKAFSKELMAVSGVPTADSGTFTDPLDAKDFAAELLRRDGAAVLKASGPALGKGAVICTSEAEIAETIRSMMVDRDLGAAGETVVVEQFLEGREFSLLTLVSGANMLSLPVAQDYKRIHDGGLGPNTGGMGSYSPVSWVDKSLVAETEERVVAPILASLAARGIPYRGVLFSGLMLSEGVPFCLEYNVRFGDPETQSVMPRLGQGFAEALLACAEGRPIEPVFIHRNAAATVVMASEGYPATPRTGFPIEMPKMSEDDALVFQAGTKLDGGVLKTAGGRVLSVTGVGENLEEARTRAYAAVGKIRFEGMQYRSDIALKP
jgi:phosphoribosylamine--glycine ligase